jgi:hypothetical protein
MVTTGPTESTVGTGVGIVPGAEGVGVRAAPIAIVTRHEDDAPKLSVTVRVIS